MDDKDVISFIISNCEQSIQTKLLLFLSGHANTLEACEKFFTNLFPKKSANEKANDFDKHIQVGSAALKPSEFIKKAQELAEIAFSDTSDALRRTIGSLSNLIKQSLNVPIIEKKINSFKDL